MAESYLKSTNKSNSGSIKALDSLKKLVLIDDKLKKVRMEWILGVPMPKSRQNIRTRQNIYGAEIIDVINDEIYEFKSFISKSSSEPCFLAQILKHKRNRVTDDQCCYGLKTLVEMCLADDDVMKYVFSSPSPTAQWARYVDWIYPYVTDVKDQMDNARNTYVS